MRTPKATTRRKSVLKSPVRRPAVDFRRLFDASCHATLVLNRRGRYVEANRAACERLGYGRANLLTKRLTDLASPADGVAIGRYREELIDQGRSVWSGSLIRADGTPCRVCIRGSALSRSYFQEVLDLGSGDPESDDALRASQSAYAVLLDLCHAAVISAGPDGLITTWNPAARELFGYSATEALGMPVARLIPARHLQRHLEGFFRHATPDPPERFGRFLHTEGLRKDGTEVPVEISLGVGRQAGRAVFTAVVRNMSEHHRVLEQLNDALQRLVFHVERMPLAYIVWDTAFRVVEWNPAAERTFGYTRAEAVGRHAYELVVPPDVVPAVDVVWNDLLRGDTSSHSINDNRRKDGSRRTCEWFNTPLRDFTGGIHGVASMVMDVSERELMEAQVRNAQKLESLGVLAGGIAHDFNSSLMVILGNAALLRSAAGLPPRALAHLDLIEEAGSRARDLVNHLLAYARTGRHNPQPTDLNRVIQDALAFVQSSMGKRHELALHLADGLPPIRADQGQIVQILLNLCVNAKQAMPDGGTVSLATRRAEVTAGHLAHCVPYDAKPGSFAELEVRDHGCGMDEATVSRIFDPFFTTKPDGHGLGLAAVLGILRQHGGAAWVESTPAKGTGIHVYFPVLAEA